ncbi:MAG: hypothetical protein F6J99_03960 [Moorea sp. SIO4G3]|nr:hypothetical protein [Moorena sp. SIO4G3]
MVRNNHQFKIDNNNNPIVLGNFKGNVNNIYNSEQKRNLAEAASEIQQLLEQLEKSYTGKWKIATKAREHIESNPKLFPKTLSALKAGSIQALEQFLNHPASSFVIGALEEWDKN